MATKAKESSKKEETKAKSEKTKNAGDLAPSLEEAKANGYKPSKFTWVEIEEGKENKGDFRLTKQRIVTKGVTVPYDAIVRICDDEELVKPYKYKDEFIYPLSKEDLKRFDSSKFLTLTELPKTEEFKKATIKSVDDLIKLRYMRANGIKTQDDPRLKKWQG